jgi:hypothetical protein
MVGLTYGWRSRLESRMRSESKHQRSLAYLIVVALFFWSLALPLWIIVEWAGWASGTTLSPAAAALTQERDPRILWLGSFADFGPFKLERAKLQNPEVLVVGNSRCGQVRAAMLRPYRTYNACTSAWSFSQVLHFVDLATAQSRPAIVIFTLDYFLFSDSYATAWEKIAKMDYDQGIRSHFRRVNDLVTNAKSFLSWHPTPAAGALVDAIFRSRTEKVDGLRLLNINSIVTEHGYRYDGSTLYGPGARSQTEAKNRAGAADFVAAFNGAPDMSGRQIADLQRLADLSKRRGFVLVGVQLPILKAAVDFLDTDLTYWSYAGMWREFESERSRKLFKDMNIVFFDLARDAVTADSRNFIDPAHPSEAGTLGALVHLGRDSRFRDTFPLLDLPGLEADYERAMATDEFVDIYH